SRHGLSCFRHLSQSQAEIPLILAVQISRATSQLHGHRYARFRSLVRVQTQCLLAAAAQNIKKIAMALTKPPKQAQA
ncbi:hypothetical protein, partial [Roseibium marinum]|uniref:hypothetical protein n=1 Tax=Roseibium marinum TaxID=281252 RepID=UPI0011AFC373